MTQDRREVGRGDDAVAMQELVHLAALLRRDICDQEILLCGEPYICRQSFDDLSYSRTNPLPAGISKATV
jgi:hypothetical protein